MKIFVTGSTGFVGSHLVDYFLERGEEVYCLVRKTSNLQWLKDKNVKLVYGDIREKDNKELEDVLKNVDYVYHIAGAIMGLKKEDYFRVNEDGVRNLLEFMLKSEAKPKRYLQLSSLAAVGPGEGDEAVNEDKEPAPVSWYGESKLAGEKVAKEYEKYFPITIVRPPPVYGPRDYGMLQVFQAIKKGLQPQIGKPTKTNFVYVNDLVKGIVLAAESENGVGEIFHIGDNENITDGEFIQRVAKTIGKKLFKLPIPLFIVYIAAFFAEMKMKITKKPDIFNLQKMQELKQTNFMMDISKAKKILGYEPEYPVEKGGEITYKWYDEKRWL